MAQELGRIERPEAASFDGTRKLFLVPLIYSPPEPPADYVGMLERFWAGVRNQVRRLAERTGPILHIYHEGVFSTGDQALKTIEQINPRSHALVSDYYQANATIEALEDAEAFAESIDWQRCLMAGLASRKVVEQAVNGYRDAVRRRYETMAQTIDQTLKSGEAALLLIQEDHSIQFPKDVQVFYVAPPALDEIHRWIRAQEERQATAETQAASSTVSGEAEK